MDGDRKLLEYADIVLRARDVSTLTGSAWLNDQILSFYFEYLTAKADDLAKIQTGLLSAPGPPCLRMLTQ